VQFIGDMLAFHTVRSGVAMAVDGGAGARVVCGKVPGNVVKAKKRWRVRSAEARQGHVQSRKVNKV